MHYKPFLKLFLQNSCTVSLFHTPKLRGMKKKLIPDKFNEVIGLQHCKLFVFDDSVIVSGANLSTDYFTNRQDRYILIENCEGTLHKGRRDNGERNSLGYQISMSLHTGC